MRARVRRSGRLRSLYDGLRGFVFGVRARKASIEHDSVSVEDHVQQIPAVRPVASRETDHRLNLLLPSINASGTFGGIQTALDLFEAIGAGETRRRIVTLAPIDGTAAELLGRYPVREPLADALDPAHVVSLSATRERSLAVGPRDVFVATFWTTADLARRLRRWQAEQFGTAPSQFAYVVQDFEPGFYPWSAQYLLAHATYEAPDETIAIFNTDLLRDYFHGVGLSFGHEFVFEPNLPARLRSRPASDDGRRRRRIVIYGRPRTRRNAFPLIVDGLRRWRESFPASSDWLVVSAGQAHPDIDLGQGLTLRSLGRLSLDDYARLLAESAVGVSLMVSPHPSYPPLEMASQGMLVLTNRFAGKDLSTWHTNITSLRATTADGIADDLRDLCLRYESEPGTGPAGRWLRRHFLDGAEPFPFAAAVADLLRRGSDGAGQAPEGERAGPG